MRAKPGLRRDPRPGVRPSTRPGEAGGAGAVTGWLIGRPWWTPAGRDDGLVHFEDVAASVAGQKIGEDHG